MIVFAVDVGAQTNNDSPIVQANKVVVQEAPLDSSIASVTGAPMDSDIPVLMASWEQITSKVPNLSIEAAGPSSFGAIYALRGLANTPYFSDPAVTLYFGDIPLAGNSSFPTDLFGFASAAVFRGPQPVEFGRAGDGGVIALSPISLQGGGEFRMGIGDFNARSAALEVGGEEGSRADFNVAAAFAQREGYIENTQVNQPVDDLHSLTAFAKERFRPTSASELSLEILADRHRDGAAPLVPLGGPLYTVERSNEGETNTDLFGAAFKYELDTGMGRITSATSYTNWKLNPYDDWIVIPPPIQSDLTQNQEAWNEEIHISSIPQGGLSWNAGAWLSEGTTTGASDRTISGILPFDKSDFGYTRHEEALFAEVVLVPKRDWQISIGGRIQQTEKNYHQDEQIPTSGLHFLFARTDSDFLPKIAATCAVDSDTTANASVAFGSRPGGFAAYTDKPSLIPFAAESTVAFETGLQSSFADKTLILAANLFDYEIRNYQIERSFSPADYFVATAPRARSLGAEMEATWKPAAAWTIEASGGLTDATLLEFHDPLTGDSYDGKRAPYAPVFTFGLNAQCRSTKGWFVAGSLSATGKTFYSEAEDPTYAQGAYALVDARVGFDAARWRATFYVKNAAGKGYYALIIPGVNSASPGPPRTAGMELAVKF
jgi:hypothetical protein